MKMGVQCIRGDITDPETLREGMTGAEIVVHNAGWYGIRDTGKGPPADVCPSTSQAPAMCSIWLWSWASPARCTSHRSPITVKPVPEARDESYQRQAPYKMWYEQTKAEAHKIAQQYQQRGLPLILVCPAHVVGPNDPTAYGYFQRMHVNRLMPPVAWAADTIHSPVHVEDVAKGIALAVEKGLPGETYILAGEPTAYARYSKYGRKILAVIGSKPIYPFGWLSCYPRVWSRFNAGCSSRQLCPARR